LKDSTTTAAETTTTTTAAETTTEEENQQLQDIKAEYEEQLGVYAQRNATFKEKLRELSEVNYHLKQQLDDFKQNNQGVVRILNLEEEVAKWETLYAETAEVGAAKMKHLEEELEDLRGCLTAGKESATREASLEQMENICHTLIKTMEDMQTRENEFNEYKRKSAERITMLTEMLDYAKTEKEKEVEHLKRKQIHEYTLMEKIENLEDEVQAKAAIIERERNQAMKREARLKEQLRKLQYSDPKATQDDADKQISPDLDFLDSACTTLSIALEGAFHWCGPSSAETSDPPPNNDRAVAPEEKCGGDFFSLTTTSLM
jgi:chromosome segregation ATPase